jgi:hypothetical protein
MRSFLCWGALWPLVTSCAPASRHEDTASTAVEPLSAFTSPSVSEEIAIDPIPRGVPDHYAAAIATTAGGSGYLSVWSRSIDGELRGARLGGEATLLDPVGFHVAFARVDVVPRVVFDGTEYVVVWAEGSSPRTFSSLRISEAGEVLGPPVEIAQSPAVIQPGRLATDGQRVLVPIGPTGTGVLLERGGTPTGTVVDIVGPAERAGLDGGNAAFDGTDFVVVYTNPAVVGARLSPAGLGTGTLFPIAPRAAAAPKVAESGGTIGVFYHDGQSAYALSLLTNPVTTATVVTSPSNSRFDIAGASNGFWLSYTRTPAEVRTTKFDATGVRVAPDSSLTTRGPMRALTASALSPRALAVTHDQLEGRLLGPARGPFTVTPTAAPESEVSVAANDSSWFAVWSEQTGWDTSALTFRGGRIGFDGSVLDPGGFLLHAPQRTSPYAAPRVASNGSDFLVTFNDDTRTTALRVSADGTVGTLHALESLMYMGANSSPAEACSDGTNYLVLWPDAGALVSADGSLLLEVPLETSHDLGIAFNGSSYLAAWIETHNDTPTSTFTVHAARVATGGGILDAPLGIPLNTPATQAFGMSVVARGDAWLLAWNEVMLDGSNVHTVVGRSVGADLALGPARTFVTTDDDTDPLALAITDAIAVGSETWLAWQGDGWGPATTDVRVQRLDANDTPLDANGFQVAATPAYERSARLSAGPAGVLAAYRLGPEPPAASVGGSRARFRVIRETPSGGSGGGGSGGMSGGGGGVGGHGATAGEAGEAGAPGGSGGGSGGSGGTSAAQGKQARPVAAVTRGPGTEPGRRRPTTAVPAPSRGAQEARGPCWGR